MHAPALVVGAGGLLGAALCGELERAGRTVVRATRAGGPGTWALDLAGDPGSLRIPEGTFHEAHLCAAVTGLRAAEEDPGLCRAVNVEGTLALARLLAARGVFTVFPSSDLAARPASKYAALKLEVEGALVNGEAVVRLGKVLSRGEGVLARWIRDLARGEVARPFSNRTFAPLPLPAAAAFLAETGRARRGGRVLLCGAPALTYSQALHHLARRLGLDVRLIQALEAPGPDPAPPPAPSILPIDAWETLDWFLQAAD